MKFVITDAEWDALFNEPADVFKAYCAIRRVMDYKTGIAGLSYTINERMIKEAIEVPAVRGRHKSYKPTRQQVRQPVQRLMALGLLVPMGRPMVFSLPYAVSDNSVLRMSNQWSTNHQPDEQPEKSEPKQRGYRTSATISNRDDVRMGNPHPNYPDIPTTTTARARVNVPDDSIPDENPSRGVPADWQPSAYVMEQLERRFTSEEISALLPEFRSYWHSRVNGNHLQTLDHKFVQHAERTITKQRARNEANAKPRDRHTHEQNHAHFRTPTKTPKPNIRQMHERNQSEAERVIAEAYAEMQRLAAEGGNG